MEQEGGYANNSSEFEAVNKKCKQSSTKSARNSKHIDNLLTSEIGFWYTHTITYTHTHTRNHMNIEYRKTNIVYLNVIYVNYRNLVYLCIITKPKIDVYLMQMNLR